MSETKGIVYLIGAGPGHPELITVLGLKRIKEADAVVYDDLAPYEVVAALDASVEKYYVGKRLGKHSKKQDEISNLIIALAKEGKKVARLKGGDPFIFGRGGEEVEALLTHGIEYEIIPGVTAMNAAASGAGIPVTDRRYASWVTMMTGYEAVSDSPQIDWTEMGSLLKGTIAIYMGTKNLSRIIKGLLAGGMHPETACSIVMDAYNPGQRTIYGNLSNIEAESARQRLKSPAIIIIGEAAGLTERYQWKPEGRLDGKRILITRPRLENQKICDLLRAEGALPIPLPTIDFRSFDDQNGWQQIKENLNRSGWLIFTSVTGVRFFYQQLFENGLDARILGKYKVACIGTGTAAGLREIGLVPDYIEKVSTVASFAKNLPVVISQSQEDLVIRIRGNLSVSDIEIALEERDIPSLSLTVYHTHNPKWEEHWKRSIIDSPPDVITFTSGSTFEGLVKIIGTEAVPQLYQKSMFVSIGPGTTAAMRDAGVTPAAEAKIHNVEGVVDAIVDLFQQ